MLLAIGLTGPLGSGKGTLADILASLAQERGTTVVHKSLSDQIRKEVARRGSPIERETLRVIANWFRANYGSGALAILAAAEAQQDIDNAVSSPRDHDVLIIFDAIRNPGEVHELRNQFGDRFKLIGIRAPIEVIRKNLHYRKRDDESQQALENEETLQVLVATEMGSGESIFGHNVAECFNMVDYPPIDNDGTLKELKEKAHTLYSQLILPMFERH
jgi:dephospho-CoA kinase